VSGSGCCQKVCRTNGRLADDGTRARLLRLAAPIIGQSLLGTLMFFVDAAMVGRLRDPAALGAMGITAPLLWMLMVVAIGFATGGFALVARATGAGDRERACQAAAVSLRLCVFAGAAVALSATLLLNYILSWMGAKGVVAIYARAYLLVVFAAFPLAYAAQSATSSLRAAGQTTAPFIAGILANALNIFLNAVLVFGLLGAPGVVGAAFGTVAAQALYFVLLLVFLRRGLGVRTHHARATHLIKPMLRISAPALLNPAVNNTGYLVFTSFVVGLGAVSLAAHRVAISLESLSFMPGSAVGIAAGSLAGQALGAGDKKRAYLVTSEAMFVTAFLMSVAGLLYAACPQFLARIITNQKVVIDTATPVLRVVALAQPTFGITMVLVQTLNGTGATKLAFLCQTFGMWGVRLPLAYFLAPYGLTALWAIMVVHFGLEAILAYSLYRSGVWVKERL